MVGALALGVVLFGLAAGRRARMPLAATTSAAPNLGIAQGEPEGDAGSTVIDVSPAVMREDVIRLGMNLGREDSYDSLETHKNLVSDNPGFEGRQWQSVLRCGKVTPTSCSDAANDGGWPAGFLDGGSYEVISGTATGKSGSILHSTGAEAHTGAIVQFTQPTGDLKTGDLIVVRKEWPGNATDGWNVYVGGGAAVSAEYRDLSPRTPGVQAVRMDALGPGQFVSLSTSFGTDGRRSYLTLRGPYRISFRAKGVGGGRTLGVRLASSTGQSFVDRTVSLSGNWQDYSFDFDARDPGRPEGSITFSFNVGGAAVLLDDVSLEETAPNGTAFRNDVVATLQRLRPGVLRYMDSGQNFGCSLDNMLAPRFARKRCGFNRYGTQADSVATGLHDFLVLAEKLGAEPWYTMQLGMSTREAANLMEYLGGPVTTKYGAVRAALGHPVPWTKTFSRIHLEFGNEAWNDAQAGATIPDPDMYAARATEIFKTLRASPWYPATRFNLIANGQAGYPGLTGILLKTMQGMDTISIGPYNFNTFGDDSSIEHIFGPMFAEPQYYDDTAGGAVQQESHFASTAVHPAGLAVYETNIGTTEGTVSQASLDSTIPSLGAGIASILHELLMLRDRGITVQNTFQLGGGTYPFHNTAGTYKDERSPVWGVVVDMGGPANRVRPSFLAQQLANDAIRPTMLTTKIEGHDPTWNQPKTANDNFALDRAHELQSFAFADAASTTLILVNLSRTSAHTVGLSGACAPRGEVKVETLTSAKINDTNELADNVKTVAREEHDVIPGTTKFSLPPFSMTSLVSSNHGCASAK
jgi:alpha-L-arabinofuranosidase